MSKKLIKKVKKVVKPQVVETKVEEDIENEEVEVSTQETIENEEDLEDEEEIKINEQCRSYVNKIMALFDKDPDIAFEYDLSNDTELSIFVKNSLKASALSELMPSTVKLGDEKLKIAINPIDFDNVEELINTVFEGNPVFGKIETKNNKTYATFTQELVQFFDNNDNDPNGMYTGLYSDLAKEIIPIEGVNYSTISNVTQCRPESIEIKVDEQSSSYSL